MLVSKPLGLIPIIEANSCVHIRSKGNHVEKDCMVSEVDQCVKGAYCAWQQKMNQKILQGMLLMKRTSQSFMCENGSCSWKKEI